MSTIPAIPVLSLIAALALSSAAAAQGAFEIFEGVQNGDRLGAAVTSLGDVDGDGCDDFAIGSPGYDVVPPLGPADAGRVLVVSGRTGALIREHLGTLNGEELGYAVAGVGDLNLDGVPDLAVGRPGATELILGTPYHGGVRVFSGANGTTLFTTGGFIDDARYGHALAGLDDVTLDGVPDFAASAPLLDPTLAFSDAGAVFVLSGFGPSGPPLWISKAGANYGWSVSGIGDVDGDGSDDLIIGAPSFDTPVTDAGYVQIRSVTGAVISGSPGASQPGYRLGSAVAGVGDIDLDTFPDYVIGAEGAGLGPTAGSGIAFAHSGQTGLGLATYAGVPGGDASGHAIAGAGDVDGDGVPDVLIGAPFSNVSSPFGVSDAGVARLYSGWTDALLATVSPLVPNALGGSAVAGAGDVNGDGRADFLVGAPSFAGFSGHEGLATLFLGGSADATWSVYGTGVAGASGAPSLAFTADPKLCTPTALKLGSSATTPAPATLLLGIAAASLPTSYGGSVLVAPPWIVSSLVLPPGTTNVPVEIECDATLNGVALYMQLLVADAAAPKGVAFSQGLKAVLGT